MKNSINIHTLTVGSVDTNCYIISSGGETAIIDPGGGAFGILSYLEENNLKVKYILLTHGHFDHMLAVEELAKQTAAKVAIHKNDAGYLENPEINAAFAIKAPKITPGILLEHGALLKLGEVQIEVIHTPGHTEGSVCFRIGGKLFTGDTLFRGSYGRYDLPGGDYQTLMKSLKSLTQLEGDLAIYPGHGEGTTLDRERKFG